MGLIATVLMAACDDGAWNLAARQLELSKVVECARKCVFKWAVY